MCRCCCCCCCTLSKRIDSSTDFLSQFLSFSQHEHGTAEMRTIIINWLTDKRRRVSFLFSLLTPGPPPPPPFLLILRSFADHQMSDRAGLTLVLLGRVSNIRGFDVHGLRSRRQLFFFSRVQYRRLVVQSERLALFFFSYLRSLR